MVKHWNQVLGQTAVSLFLEIFDIGLDKALSKLI